MIYPALYAKVNVFQRQEASDSLKQFEDKLNWKDLEDDTLLDIGCGPGDVTFDYVRPALSDKFKKIVASDISPQMLEYAKEQYSSKEPRIEYQILDIGDENLKITEQFDHVTSFFCLNFLKNQRTCLKNIYNLLKPGGDGVLVIMSNFKLYELVEVLMKEPKWALHMMDKTGIIAPYYYMEDPLAEFKKYLEEVGFQNSICQLKENVHTFSLEDVDVYLQMMKLLRPESQHLSAEFEKDLLEIMKRIKMVHETKDEGYLSYGALVAYVKKN